MQITSKSFRRDGGAFALLITMIFLGVALMVFASMMYWVSGNAKITERNNQYNMSSAAAEAAVERVLAQMERDFNYQSLTTASSYASLSVDQSTWPIKYTYSDPTTTTTNAIYVNNTPPSTNTVPLDSQFSGLYGFAWNWTVSAKASPVNVSGVSVYNVPATVTETMNFASIPIFQFAIFYNINLEIAAANTLEVSGPVFSNQGIWAGSKNLTFDSTVSAVGKAVVAASDPFANNYTGTAGATFVTAGQPTSGHDSLVMPIGTNNNPATIQSIIQLQLPPAPFALGTTAAYSTNGLPYLCNAADLYITNSASGTNNASPTGTNTFVFYQDSANSAQPLAPVTPDYYILKSPANFVTNFVYTNLISGGSITNATNYAGNVRFAGYSFITNVVFYDWREGWNNGNGLGSPAKGKAVQAVQIDIVKFNYWLTNNLGISATNQGYSWSGQKVLHSGHPIDSIYVYNAVPPTSTTLPAVRLVNGIKLPATSPTSTTKYGFTVATQFPLYVWGDYNAKDFTGSALGLYGTSTATAHTYPAALIADSLTILSTNWSDAVNATISASTAGTGGGPAAGNTTINAACLEGIVPSNMAISGNYSGGVENFLRLLENWGSATLTYNGSIIVMFTSQYATNSWQQTGNYYSAPTRHWSFDQNFTKGQSSLPPLTPETKAVIRGQWMAQ